MFNCINADFFAAETKWSGKNQLTPQFPPASRARTFHPKQALCPLHVQAQTVLSNEGLTTRFTL